MVAVAAVVLMLPEDLEAFQVNWSQLLRRTMC
jgi:hypothetical protein